MFDAGCRRPEDKTCNDAASQRRSEWRGRLARRVAEDGAEMAAVCALQGSLDSRLTPACGAKRTCWRTVWGRFEEA